MLKRPVHRGFTVVELMVALTIAGMLMMLGMPAFVSLLNNSQVRAAAEGVQTGLQLARAEAVKRNTAVRFQLTSTADNSCAISTAGRNWVVSLDDPVGACAAATSDTTAPRIAMARPASEGGSNVTVAGFLAGTPANGQAVAIFNGLGQLTTPAAGINFRFTNPGADACAGQGGDLRCLQVNVSRSGQIRMCDPNRSDVNDSEAC
ncbi:prepilin-type N-terminal cleavage/methylation domain-containing protein [Solimonas sp. K1W22B-7]|uniref:GspH/FimT family pseudopilin n=1 Tax=Solimonas sp. K1W22B-7 TaxID=2303331 RepID=UPI000E33658D|nr:GspH/FimT family pseudopilin [Solimonas sp. K1W22B-7]AXQ28962.1 prepilin-type N-terminal cleavage/methylation domain-containing protein [Solimonas sp. K1W22B-7]